MRYLLLEDGDGPYTPIHRIFDSAKERKSQVVNDQTARQALWHWAGAPVALTKA